MLYIINGDPIPLQRSRSKINRNRKVFGNRKKILVYSDQQKEKIAYQWTLKAQKHTLLDRGCDIIVYMTFYMPIPKSTPKSKLIEFWDKPHKNKPDLDNLIKWVLDCGNGILWVDDCIISEICAKKKYAECTKTHIEVFTKESHE